MAVCNVRNTPAAERVWRASCPAWRCCRGRHCAGRRVRRYLSFYVVRADCCGGQGPNGQLVYVGWQRCDQYLCEWLCGPTTQGEIRHHAQASAGEGYRRGCEQGFGREAGRQKQWRLGRSDLDQWRELPHYEGRQPAVPQLGRSAAQPEVCRLEEPGGGQRFWLPGRVRRVAVGFGAVCDGVRQRQDRRPA